MQIDHAGDHVGRNNLGIFIFSGAALSYFLIGGKLSSVESVIEINIALDFETLFLNKWPTCVKGFYKTYMLNIMLTASKKVITRNWMTDKPPTLENVVQDILLMEKLTFALRLEQDRFEKCWTPWWTFMSTKSETDEIEVTLTIP
ncbi:hypothetical protein ATANTOWER_025670 [Ataeniobius toweri]|uniref:Uncharacterized protein n=1 Tax=Ataeniobius toweri TaxID=208326 RepID=A0ABU7A8E1_9TELE|nr:hypothetical protein [Ataeniobius toweri]